MHVSFRKKILINTGNFENVELALEIAENCLDVDYKQTFNNLKKLVEDELAKAEYDIRSRNKTTQNVKIGLSLFDTAQGKFKELLQRDRQKAQLILNSMGYSKFSDIPEDKLNLLIDKIDLPVSDDPLADLAKIRKSGEVYIRLLSKYNVNDFDQLTDVTKKQFINEGLLCL